MSDFLREHIQDFGFKHAEIARRASKLNQATTYRVVEGDTQNPSLNSITGIIEAISLTDADAGVLYRKMGVHNAKPRLFVHPNQNVDYETACLEAKNHLDSGHIREAAHNVMTMFDLAQNDEQLCRVYELAGIVYMGMGRWEEAQVNFEAADAHLCCDVDDPSISQDLVDRKHTLMTNIGSLMVKRGNPSWANIFARSVTKHPRVSNVNKGWGYLVLGDAFEAFEDSLKAKCFFEQALFIFQSELNEIQENLFLDKDNRDRRCQQAQGNIRWARIHLLRSEFVLGDIEAGARLKILESDWWHLDPEASTMAGLFYVEGMKATKRKENLLRQLYKRAKSHNLGDIVQRISSMLCLALCVVGAAQADLRTLSPPVEISEMSSLEKPKLGRGNTGK